MNVRETVEDALSKQGVSIGQYGQYANPVIAALETRESEIVRNLTMYAVEQGLNEEAARRALADCGLNVVWSVPQTDTPVTTEDPRIAQMERVMEEMQATLRSMREGN